MSNKKAIPTEIPAQLSFLTIYNPLLAPSDEKLSDQVVFYTSRESSGGGGKDEQNRELRQIGLARGMVDFARFDARSYIVSRG